MTKRQRDEAAMILLVCASGAPSPFDAMDGLGASLRAEAIAIEAWRELAAFYPESEYGWFPPARDAEAAQLLLEGWSPGDPVERLP